MEKDFIYVFEVTHTSPRRLRDNTNSAASRLAGGESVRECSPAARRPETKECETQKQRERERERQSESESERSQP